MFSNHDRSRRADGVSSAAVDGRPWRLAWRRWPMFVAGVFVAAIFAAACSSDSGSPAPTTPSDSTPASSAVPLATVAPLDPSSLSYQQDTGPSNQYRIDVPAGWEQEGIVAPGLGRRYVLNNDGVRIVAVSVICALNRSIDDMIAEDSDSIGQRGGTFGIGPVVPVTVGGLPGKMIDFLSGGLNPVEGRTIYFASARCGWRLSLQPFVAGGREQFSRLFERVAQSFQELPAGGPG